MDRYAFFRGADARTGLAGLLLAAGTTAPAQVFITTVADGPWHSPSTWDCTCIPANDDNVQVEHAVTLTQDTELGYGLLNVTADGSITGDSAITFTLYSAFNNSGRIAVDRFLLLPGGAIDYALNGDSLLVGSLCFLARPNLVNAGVIHVQDTLRSGALWENTIGARVRASHLDGNAQVLNQGTIDGDGIFIMPFDNRGTITHQGWMFQQGTSVNTGLIDLEGDLTVMAGFEQAGHMTMQGVLTVNGSCTIAPDTALVELVGDLVVNGTLSGSGVLCVTNNTSNFGFITGTLDLCDITRTDTIPPFIDLNEGTVAATVVFCDNPFCAPAGVGIHSENATNAPRAFPNPALDRITIGPLPGSMRVASVRMHDALGRSLPVRWRHGSGAVHVELGQPGSGPVVITLLDPEGMMMIRVPVWIVPVDQRR